MLQPVNRTCPYRRALVIANPIAGRGRGERAGRELVEGLVAMGCEAELRLTGAAGDARPTHMG